MKTKLLSAFLFILCVITGNNLYSTVNSFSTENVESRMRHVSLSGRLAGFPSKKSTPQAPQAEAYIVDNLITINFNIVMHNEPLRITIKDAAQNIVFEQTFTVIAPGSIQFPFNIIDEELYLLEIFSNKGYLYGEF